MVGFKDISPNAIYFDDLNNMMKNKSKQFIDRVRRPNYWKKKGVEKMKFDAVVGNPPYQIQGGSGGNNDAPIYQEFGISALKLNPNYITLIMPIRWFSAGRENLLREFRKIMLTSGKVKKLIAYSNSNDIFSSVEIKGGVCYYLKELSYDGKCDYTLIENDVKMRMDRDLNKFDILIRNPKISEIVSKVEKNKSINNKTLDTVISADTPFGIPSNARTSKKNSIKVYKSSNKTNTKLYHIENKKRKVEFVETKDIKKNIEYIDSYKVLIPGASGSGNDPYVLGKVEFADKNSVCSQSYLFIPFDKKEEAINCIKYIETKFVRILVSAVKISQSAPSRVYRFVPLQDFTDESDINWNKSIKEIDKQLYKKYNLSEDEIDYIENKIKEMK